LDLTTQQRQAKRHHLSAQQQRGNEPDECEFHTRSAIYYYAVDKGMLPHAAEAGSFRRYSALGMLLAV